MSVEAWVFALLLVHLAATLYMTGLIWFVQRVHYPLLARVGSDAFVAYESEHIARTSPVVGPAMVLEAATAIAAVSILSEGAPARLAWLGLGALIVIWLSTALLQVPLHRSLSDAFDAEKHRRLVATNWIRTISWSLRSLTVAAAMFWFVTP